MTSPQKKVIIAIDGHSSCGKSTFARSIANKMDYTWIDSGAMYRAVTLACMERGLLREGKLDEDRVPEVLENIVVRFEKGPDGTSETLLNGVNVESRIRSIEVASNVSLVSKSAAVRRKLVSLQREMAADRSVVMEGRDIGTVVFPHADIKIFMTAKTEIRAKRRYRELKEKGIEINFSEVRENIIERDRLDETRRESPLVRAPDSVLLDNSYMTPRQQIVWFEDLISKTGIY